VKRKEKLTLAKCFLLRKTSFLIDLVNTGFVTEKQVCVLYFQAVALANEAVMTGILGLH